MKNAMSVCKWACFLYMSKDVLELNHNCLKPAQIRSFAIINSIYLSKRQDQIKICKKEGKMPSIL